MEEMGGEGKYPQHWKWCRKPEPPKWFCTEQLLCPGTGTFLSARLGKIPILVSTTPELFLRQGAAAVFLLGLHPLHFPAVCCCWQHKVPNKLTQAGWVTHPHAQGCGCTHSASAHLDTCGQCDYNIPTATTESWPSSPHPGWTQQSIQAFQPAVGSPQHHGLAPEDKISHIWHWELGLSQHQYLKMCVNAVIKKKSETKPP